MDFVKRSSDANSFRENAAKESGFLWNLLRLLFVIFVVLFLGYFGLRFGYAPFLRSQIDARQNEIDALATRIPKTEQDKFLKFYFQLLDLKTLLANHVFASELFPFLEENTNHGVFYKNVSLNALERSVSVEGVAVSSNALAEQLEAYDQANEVVRFTLGNASTERSGRITFGVVLYLAPQLFKL